MNRNDVHNHRALPRLSRLALLAAAAFLASGTAPLSAHAQDPDSVPRFNMDSVVVDILMTPVRVGTSPFPISVAAAA